MKFENVFSPSNWLSEHGGLRYVQLRRQLEQAIADQTLPPGTPLPPEREIAKLTGLSRVTVRKAIAPLVENGLIEQRRGWGTTVANPIRRVEQSLSRLTSFSEDMARRGLSVSSKWLKRSVTLPSPDEMMKLGLGLHESVSRLERIRFADDTPMAIERAAVPMSVLDNPFRVTTSLYETLERLGKKPVRAIQHIMATNLGQQDAGLLEVDELSAGLQITRISYLESGQVAEFTRSIYRGDAYDFVAELKIGKRG